MNREELNELTSRSPLAHALIMMKRAAEEGNFEIELYLPYQTIDSLNDQGYTITNWEPSSSDGTKCSVKIS